MGNVMGRDFRFSELGVALCAVLRPAASTTLDTVSVKGSTHNVVPDAWEIAHATTANQHHRVLLQPMTLTGNVRRDFNPV